ncbi:NAD(P)-binding domain-containing protein [Flexibacterium corallicola]|uniref:NAD(P)-binding domain-containing protein n=1 Tax=Flexibacterium corallicola TaxID=3037259 RepID=UPI00286F3A6F|nr:NAD(P)-binding domain-containing protein [Pseudovibrio sp. M1P-2-3]
MVFKVAIVGAGPTGISAAIELKRHGIVAAIFETRNCIGGQWAYEEVIDEPVDIRGTQSQYISSAMYPKLRTNLTKRAMQVCDYKLPEDLPQFPQRLDVLNYLEATVNVENILPMISFNMPVKNIKKVGGCWHVTTEKSEEAFSHVIVATGKDSFPSVPEIDGLESFTGKVTHSQFYRLPQHYKGQRIVLIGASVSAQDISHDLSAWARRIYICGTFPSSGHKCFAKSGIYGQMRNISQHARPMKVEGNNIHLQDNTVLSNVDIIILCTGYIYSFPLLQNALTDVELRGRFVGPLYLNMFYPVDPTLIFLGLPRFSVHFAYVHLQSLYCAKILSRELVLPPIEEMKRELANEGCALQLDPANLKKYHDKVFESFKKLSRLNGNCSTDWRGYLTALNEHKRYYQEDYRNFLFSYDIKGLTNDPI